uniref:glycogenin glucosyltransferase n=1 Tax=Caenorhabditis japonica TaxID=281687 RepID=A0A8R1DHF4_CAEJA
MKATIFVVVFLLLIPQLYAYQKYAYVSVLSSNDFLIPAKVLAYRLKKLNSAIPYVIIVTQDILKQSVDELREQGVIIHEDTKIDTPYLKTHKARKYQYTKIRLWKMTEFDVIVHLDLDVLPTRDISELFECGSFCAVFRHSDMFNSGVFVLKTNKTTFNEMQEKVVSTVSYDGGDQGFLNSFFNDLKYSPMYDSTRKSSDCAIYSMRRLSAKFNYDIGMYYLNNGRFLVDPNIIHYTMGPTKPWFWWTYPLFDLNWIWLDARQEMERNLRTEFDVSLLLAATNALVIVFLVAVYMIIDRIGTRHVSKYVSNTETHLAFHGLYSLSLYFSWKLAYETASPIPAWIYFTSNMAWINAINGAIYTRLRTSISIKLKSILKCVVFLSLCQALFWIFVSQISTFSTRVIVAFFLFFTQQFLVVNFSRYVFTLWNLNCSKNYRYQCLPNNNDLTE